MEMFLNVGLLQQVGCPYQFLRTGGNTAPYWTGLQHTWVHFLTWMCDVIGGDRQRNCVRKKIILEKILIF